MSKMDDQHNSPGTLKDDGGYNNIGNAKIQERLTGRERLPIVCRVAIWSAGVGWERKGKNKTKPRTKHNESVILEEENK